MPDGIPISGKSEFAIPVYSLHQLPYLAVNDNKRNRLFVQMLILSGYDFVFDAFLVQLFFSVNRNSHHTHHHPFLS